MKKAVLVVALLALASSIVPFGARASHCKAIFILSGEDSIEEPFSDTRAGGFNLGSATCPEGLSNNPDLPALNHLTPGAADAWGALSYSAGDPISGTIKGIPATWTFNELRSRYETQAVSIGTASSITLTVTYEDAVTHTNKTATITYTKAP